MSIIKGLEFIIAKINYKTPFKIFFYSLVSQSNRNKAAKLAENEFQSESYKSPKDLWALHPCQSKQRMMWRILKGWFINTGQQNNTIAT